MSITIVRFARESHALTLVAYYKQRGIYAEINKSTNVPVDPTQSGLISPAIQEVPPESNNVSSQYYDVCIYDYAQQAIAIDIANEFVTDPNNNKFQQAAWQHGGASKHSMSLFSGIELESIKFWRKHLFTHLVGINCLIIFALMSLGFAGDIFEALKIQYFSDLADSHQWWRLIGPNFMHGSTFHLLANIVWWWLLAGKLERKLGTSALITLFVVSSLVSNIAQLLYSGPNFVGLSGVVYALFGFMWFIGHLRPTWDLSLPNGIIGFMLIWLVVGYADLLWVSMANEAHTFGLVTGCLLALILHRFTPSGRVESDK